MQVKVRRQWQHKEVAHYPVSKCQGFLEDEIQVEPGADKGGGCVAGKGNCSFK